MPFCTQCGNQVASTDTFCARCGTRQAPATAGTAAGANASGDVLRNVSPRTASMLCYVPWVGWIAAILALASKRFQRDRTVRFNAFQGIYLFVAWLLLDWVMMPFLHLMSGHPAIGVRLISGTVHLALFGTAIWMIVKTAQDQVFRLPIIGELAERSVAEQVL